MSFRTVCAILFVGFSFPVFAFNPPKDTAGPLTAAIEAPAKIAAVETPVDAKLTLENAGDAPLQGTVRYAVVDKWRVTPTEPQPFALDPHGSVQLPFQVVAGTGTYSALYPIHAYITFSLSGAESTAHPIALVEAVLPPNPVSGRPWVPLSIPANATVALSHVPIFRVVNTVFGETPQTMPVGWTGQDPRTYGTVMPEGIVKRGDAREAIQIHPAWRDGKAGTTMLEIPVKMPEIAPIRLRFGNAVRDTRPEEPASDGVTFRVRTLPNEWAPGAEGQVLYEKTTAEKVWQDADVDLSHLAGQTVRLQLESHPGPANNTTCDASYWGGLTLVTGTPVPPLTIPTALPRLLGVLDRDGTKWEINVAPGARGLFDAEVKMSSGANTLSFKGFQVRVLGDSFDDPCGVSTLAGVREDQNERGMEMTHAFQTWAGLVEIAGMIWIEAGTLRVKFWLKNAPDAVPWQSTYIEDVGLGLWSEQAPTVYAGAGNVLRNPETFSLGFDGHRLASSHVGFDFANGVSIVQGMDHPPTCLQVNPVSRAYTLHGAGDATITLIPCPSVWAGGKVWRDVSGRVASQGVQKLAGRFAFDLWGGGYAETRDALQKAFRYGLTDSVVVFHNWQRWGYDYRLPDIFPPNPDLGSQQDFAALSALCRDNGALFAPHDNYIDLYPDADGFSYDKVAFGGDGQPVRAWLNEGRGAQSFRWRPDQVQPVLERNLGLIKEAFAPNAYFIDVWSSMGPHDYWTPDGRFVPRTETRKAWGNAFAWIRNTLGDQAPMISESGHDQLIGFLDGAQANHLRVDANPPANGEWMVWKVTAEAAERIPWFDFAWHDRFALHGAGYESRYAAGLDVREHGIYSDDYITTEIMCGRPAMADAPFNRNVVRKYWLTHAAMRAVAALRMDNVEFVGNDLQRQHIRWANTGETWVNRSATDWTVKERVLPQYGFYIKTPLADGVFAEAAIERQDGMIVEWARSPESLYVNARPVAPAPDDPSQVRQNPESKALAVAGVTTNGAFRLTRDGNMAMLLPLPDSAAFDVRLPWTALPWQMPKPEQVATLAADGSVINAAPAQWDGDALIIQVTSDVFAWRLGAPPAPAPVPAPEPAPAPEAAPAPAPTPAPEAAPAPVPEPAPEPTPAPAPEAAPAPAPAPEAAPAPAPEPTPAPEPAPAPAPAPEAAPAPAPEPSPAPEVVPASAPAA